MAREGTGVILQVSVVDIRDISRLAVDMHRLAIALLTFCARSEFEWSHSLCKGLAAGASPGILQ